MTSGRCRATLCALVALLAHTAIVEAQPAVTGSSGTWSHQGTVTISGTGFGSKGTVAPVVWDDASGASITSKWNGAWPDCAGSPLAYRTPAQVGRGIPLPHSHITKYISGAHMPGTGANCGYNVIMFKTRTVSLPAYTYATWYERVDDNWTFGGDDNFKTFAYSVDTTPYELPNNWYLEYNPRPTSPTSGATWHINDDGASLQTPDANGHNWWWGGAINPMSGVWKKIEMELKYTTASDGYIKLWENGTQKIDYRGRTDNLAGTTRTEGIGGYARNYGTAGNWRYFADVYLDYSRARVILGNAPTLAASTRREVQIPTSWSALSITLSANLGAFSDGQTAYVYVFDANGVSNTSGIPITIGAGGTPDTTPPSVTATSPANGVTGVSATSTVTVTFSEAMDAASITTTSFELRTASSTLVPALVGYDAGTRVATLTPTSALTGGVAYTATVKAGSGGVRDAAGNALASNYTWSFTTAAQAPPADTTPPTVSSVSPANGATGVSVAALAIVTFSEAMDASTISTSTIELRDASNALVTATVSYDSVTRTATLTPSGVLANGAVHTVTVKSGAGGVKDAAGNPLASTFTSSFTTVAAAPTGTLVASYAFNENAGVTARDGSGNNNAGTVSGAAWTPAGKYGTGLDFKGTTDWVTVANAGTLGLTTAMTLEAWVYPRALSGWNTVVMKETTGGLAYALYANDNSPWPASYVRMTGASNSTGVSGTSALSLNTWTHLAATYDGATLKLFVNGTLASSQAASGVMTASTGPLHIGGNTIWGEYFTGVIDEVRIYSRALTGAEIQTDMATALDGAPIDTTPPTVTAVSPGAGTRVGTKTTVSATFSEAMQSATIGTTTFQLRDPLNALVSASVSYTAGTRTAKLTPASPLTSGTLYRVTIKSGASGVKDLANNSLAADNTWTFTAAKPAAPVGVRIVK